MKKYILSIGIGLIGVAGANAQVITGGPELGLNMTYMSQRVKGGSIETEMLLGLKAGGVLDIGISRSFSIQPGLFFSMKGYQNDYVQTVRIGGLDYREEYAEQVRVNYLEIPINFLYKANMPTGGNVFIGGGPYVAAAFGGEVDVERTRTLVSNGDASSITERWNRSLEIGTDGVRDDITPVDAGLNITGGYEFNNGIFARANLGLGLTNIRPDGDDDNYLRNVGVGLSVGYMFGK